jgi:hypothetical protein
MMPNGEEQNQYMNFCLPQELPSANLDYFREE